MLSAVSSTSAAESGAKMLLKYFSAKIVSRRFRKSSFASVIPIGAFSSAIILLIEGSSLKRAIEVITSFSKYQATVDNLSKAVSTKPISNPGVSSNKFNSARRIPATIPWLIECKNIVLATQVENGGLPAAVHSPSCNCACASLPSGL